MSLPAERTIHVITPNVSGNVMATLTYVRITIAVDRATPIGRWLEHENGHFARHAAAQAAQAAFGAGPATPVHFLRQA